MSLPINDADVSGDEGTDAQIVPLKTNPFYNEISEFFADNYAGQIPPDDVIKYVTDKYLATLEVDCPPEPKVIKSQLIAFCNDVFSQDNKSRPQGNRITLLKTLNDYQVAQILLKLHHVVKITPTKEDTDREYDLLAMYVTDGPNQGVHTTSEEDITAVARLYNSQLSVNEGKEVRAILKEAAPRVRRCSDRDLIAVNNGIFNFKTKELIPFDPALVFTTKSHVDYDVHAVSPVIAHPVDEDWEVEEWMNTLSDDPEVVELLWEILGAIVRPGVRWNKSAWFYSEQGNNGKGTLCELMRNLVGAGAHTSIPISDFGKDFALEPLLRAQAIIVDENDVGSFIDKAANFKAIATHDVIQINRKYRMPIAFQFHGFMVQCLNELPRFKDKSESFYRRQLFVPFTKWFGSTEKAYIKNDYLKRDDVLRYVLKRVLHMDFYTLSEPAACKEVLAEYKEYNDPVRAWWEEFRNQFVWDLVPLTFSFDLYMSWFAQTNPSGSPVGRNAFINDLVAIVRNDPEWHCPNKRKNHRIGNKMNATELLIAEYGLKKWMDPTYTGNDPIRKSQPNLQDTYRGLLRTTPQGSASTSVDGGDEAEQAND